MTGYNAASIVRFPTGYQHWVYDVTMPDNSRLVARLCQAKRHALMESAAYWSDMLRPRGVPLPEIMGRGLDHPFPCLLLERFSGCDLGHVLRDLTRPQLAGIARGLVAAQLCVDELDHGTKYGFAARAGLAPHGTWYDALQHEISRAAGKAPDLYRRIAAKIEACSARLNAIPSLPFLHDVTTKNVIVSSDGRLSGIVDVDDLCWGDPRFVKALTLVAMRADEYSSDYVDDWMAFADEPQDDLFRLYVMIHAFGLYAETLGSFDNGNSMGGSPERVDRLLEMIG